MAEYIVFYNEGATPQNVTDLQTSVSESLFEGQTNFLVEPDLSAVTGLLRKYWKVVGSSVVPMTAGEQTEVDDAEATASLALVRAAADGHVNNLEDVGVIIRALALVTMDEINILRAQHALANRTIAQLKTAMQNKISSGDAD